MKITAVIPVRKGSERVKEKNLRPFADTTLLEVKLKTLMQANIFDDIIINTDSEEAIQIAISYGVSYHRREEYYASSACSGSEFLVNLAQTTDTDLFAYCPCTSPFTSIETMKKCIKMYKESETCDSVATVSQIKEFLWLDGKALNYDPQNTPKSQDLPDIIALNYGFSIISKDDLIRKRNLIGDCPLFVTTGDVESIDIDDEIDFFIAEQLYKKLIIENKNILE